MMYRTLHARGRAALIAIAAFALWTSVAAQRLEGVADGFAQPLGITHAGDGSERLFVVEQGGRVQVLRGGERQQQPYLDLSDRMRARGEQGLLGLAFHPRFADNGRLFAHYTDLGGDTVLSELRADPASAETVYAGTERVMLTLHQPFGNHNGGQIAFGPDGYLYLGLGDGGSGGDPLHAGQDLGTLLGTIVRLDVDGPEPYGVPADNPFVDDGAALDEIWAFGLRNPWRFSFDRETGDLWIADVGQNAVEAVNRQAADSPGGENYGWRIMEGDACFEPPTGRDPTGLTMPVITYTHASAWGRSVTGGYVYRGAEVPSLEGAYVFADYASGNVFAAEGEADDWTARTLLETNSRIASLGLDEAGELYLADHGGGVLYRFVE
jgi:glucose/arabinose dehydrogenase